MRRWFLFLLVSISLSSALVAQNRSRRLFVGIDGPVKSIRLEIAQVTKNGETFVEGPKVLTTTDEANEDRTMTVSKHYKPDGSVDFKQVTYFLPDGRAKDSQVYSPTEDKLSSRQLYYYDNGRNRLEMFTYGKDGSVTSTEVRYLDRSLSLIEGETRDKDGNVRERKVAETGATGGRQETSTAYKDDKPSGKTVTVTLSARQYERQSYDADGVLKSRVVTTTDHKGDPMEWATYDGAGNLLKKDSFEREYDSRGNCIKQVMSKWNPQTGKSEPVQILYRTIVYYEK